MPAVRCSAVRPMRGAALLAVATMLLFAPGLAMAQETRTEIIRQEQADKLRTVTPPEPNRAEKIVQPPRGLGMAHRRAARRLSAARLRLSRRRLRRGPRRAEAVRRRRRDRCDRRLFDQQLLAGADGRDAAVLRVEPRTRVVDGRLPGRAGREVLRHRPGLRQG